MGYGMSDVHENIFGKLYKILKLHAKEIITFIIFWLKIRSRTFATSNQ